MLFQSESFNDEQQQRRLHPQGVQAGAREEAGGPALRGDDIRKAKSNNTENSCVVTLVLKGNWVAIKMFEPPLVKSGLKVL